MSTHVRAREMTFPNRATQKKKARRQGSKYLPHRPPNSDSSRPTIIAVDLRLLLGTYRAQPTTVAP